MSSPRTTSSVIIGAMWFCALLAAGNALVEKQFAPTSTHSQSGESRTAPPERSEHVARRSSDPRNNWATQLTAPPVVPDAPATVLPPTPPALPATRSGVPRGQADSQAVRRPVPVSDASPADSQSPRQGPETQAPRSAPDGLRIPDPLLVDIVPPVAALVGEPALFTIRLQNPGAPAARGVSVTAAFGAAWEFPGSDEQIAEQRLGTLEAGTVRELSLALTPLSAGRHSVDFRVAAATHAPMDITAAADVRPRSVEFRLAGPARRCAGQRAEYLVSLVNISGRDLPDARVDVAYDAASLIVREASSGFVSGRGTLAWPLGTLLRDERVLIQVEFECIAESFRAPVTCDFSADGATTPQRAAWLEILPPPVVDVTIVDPDDPWTVGGPARFLISIRNRSGTAIDDLELRITTSPHFELLSVAAESSASPAAVVADGYGIDVRADRLSAQGEVRYVATARAVLPGEGLLRVLVRTSAVAAPFEVEESAVVAPAAE